MGPTHDIVINFWSVRGLPEYGLIGPSDEVVDYETVICDDVASSV
jgi:hypothetical protein